jgi:hypothetical protein
VPFRPRGTDRRYWARRFGRGEIGDVFIYTSWLDPALVPPIFADVSTFNHELAEWMNDPFTNNVTPDWYYPPPTDPATVCSQNPFLEVGDPQAMGPLTRIFRPLSRRSTGSLITCNNWCCGNGSRTRCLPVPTAAGTRSQSRCPSKCRRCTARKVSHRTPGCLCRRDSEAPFRVRSASFVAAMTLVPRRSRRKG